MLSVTCPKCSARYSMSEELYQRKGGGEAVVITCRKCKSEIRFDAHDEKTRPSNESPMPEPTQEPAKQEEENGPFVALSAGFFGGIPPVTGETAPLPDVTAKPAAEPEAIPAAQAAAASATPAETPKSEAEAVAQSAKPAEPEMPAEAPAAAAKAVEPAPASEQPIESGEMALPDDQVMSVRGDELETKTAPLVTDKGSNGASANPFAPGTNPKLKKPLPPPRKKDVEKKAEPGDDDQGPPSGTPTLTALMGSSMRPKPKNRIDEDFFAGISGPQAVSLQPPTIDVSSFGAPAVDAAPDSAPASERAPDSIPVSSHQPHKKKKKKKHGRTSSHAPPSLKPSTGSTAKPVTKSTPVSKPAPAEKKGSPMVWLLGLMVLGGAGFFFYQSKSKPAEEATAQTAAPTAEVAPTPTVPTPTPTVEATAAPTASAAASAAPTASALNKPAEAKPGEAKPAEAKPAEAKPAEAKPAEAKPAEAKPAEAKPAEEKPAAAATGATFDQAAAKAALAASATQAAGCRKGDDPAGSATVIITFAPSGRVTSANVNGPPFAGTATGGCIAAAMRKTQVPPFDGDRITVSKTVLIQ